VTRIVWPIANQDSNRFFRRTPKRNGGVRAAKPLGVGEYHAGRAGLDGDAVPNRLVVCARPQGASIDSKTLFRLAWMKPPVFLPGIDLGSPTIKVDRAVSNFLEHKSARPAWKCVRTERAQFQIQRRKLREICPLILIPSMANGNPFPPESLFFPKRPGVALLPAL